MALVLAGLPTTSTRTSDPAPAFSALPAVAKISALALSRSARSIPLVRGLAPISSATSTPSKAVTGSSWISVFVSRGNAPSSSSITTPSAARTAEGSSSSRSTTGVSWPSMAPAAMRKSAA